MALRSGVIAFVWLLAAACSLSESVSPRATFYLTLDASSATAGDSVHFALTFSHADLPGDVLYLRLIDSGQVTAVDTTAVPPQDQTLTGVLIIPPKLPAGTLTVTAVVPRRGDSASATIQISARAPVRHLSMILVSPPTPNVFTTSPFNRVVDFVAGATDTVKVSALDSTGLAWVGLALAFRDSVRVSGSSAQVAFPVQVNGPAAGLEVFARSANGTLMDTTFTVGGVADYVDHPVQSVPLAGAVHDLVYDAKRQLVYLSEQGQSAIVVLSLTTMTYATPIALSGQPAGIDLVPSGDTLVVAMANTDDLAFIDLTTAAHPVTQIALTNFAPQTLLFPRVAQDGRILLVLTGSGGAVGDYDLPSGTSQTYFHGASASTPVRSGDGTIVVLRDVAGCAFGEYDAAQHEFTVYISTCGESYPGQITASQDGARLNIGVQLFNGGLASLGSAQIPDQPLVLGIAYGAAVSDSGSDFYVVAPALCAGVACPQTAAGYYFRFALSSSAIPTWTLEEIVDTPETPVQLLSVANDQALLAVGPTSLMLFDLTRVGR